MAQRAAVPGSGRDLYRLLQISHDSSLAEIKVAYKKLALIFHPDRHNNDGMKTAKFREISDAYAILSNETKRRQYDLNHGYRYNRNRRKAPPKHYRKVYAPVQPPGTKKNTFDHQRHYEMHYGQGMMDEAVNDALKSAKRAGVDLSYQSPLGPGFSFETPINGAANNNAAGAAGNPFAKNSRRHRDGRTDGSNILFEYEEGTMFDGINGTSHSGKATIHKRAAIIQDMHGKRDIRKVNEQLQRDKQRQSAFGDAAQEEACIIQ